MALHIIHVADLSPVLFQMLSFFLCCYFFVLHPNLAAQEIRKLIGYLKNNRERIHYNGDRIGGYPIGSGGIESANKFISHTRMKRSGAWWIKETGNEMLRIRCAIYNGTYDKIFEKYKDANLSPKKATFYLTNW
jgi:hypothetical protein